ncbi:uncharacterized protein O3C94_015468 isoform 2-T2 [Discoglossus pictus]
MSVLQSSFLFLSLWLLLGCRFTTCKPACKELSDYNHGLSLKELTGRWILNAMSQEKAPAVHTLFYLRMDIHFTNESARVERTSSFYGKFSTQAQEMEYHEKDGTFKFNAKALYSMVIYPMSKNEILVNWNALHQEDQPDTIMLFSRSHETSDPALNEFKQLAHCMKQDYISVYNTIAYDEVCENVSLKPLYPLDVTKVLDRWEEVAHAGKKRKEGEEGEEHLSDSIDITQEENNVIFREIDNKKEVKQWETTLSKNGIDITKGSDKYSLVFYESCPGCLILTKTKWKDSIRETVLYLYTQTGQIDKEDLDTFQKLTTCEGLLDFQINEGYVEDVCHDSKLTIRDITVNKVFNRWEEVAHARRKQMEGEEDVDHLSNIIDIIEEEDKVIIRERNREGDVKPWKTTLSQTGMDITRVTGFDKYSLIFHESCLGCLILTITKGEYKTSEDVLYLYKTGQINKEDLEKFKKLATCERFTDFHINEGYVDETEGCDELQINNITVKEFLGKKSLIMNAYTSEDHLKLEQHFTKALIDYDVQVGKLNATYFVYFVGSVQRYETTIYMSEDKGTFFWKDATLNVPIAAFSFGENCLLFKFTTNPTKDPIPTMSFYCGSQLVSNSDIEKFEKYAKCHNHTYTKIWRDPTRQALSCFDFPPVDENIQEDKILGRWNYVQFATNYATSNPSVGAWIQFESKDGKLKFTDSTGHDYSMKLSNGKLYRPDDSEEPFMTLYRTTGETLLTDIRTGGPKIFSLFSKSENADAAQIVYFKHLASCLSLDVYPE